MNLVYPCGQNPAGSPHTSHLPTRVIIRGSMKAAGRWSAGSHKNEMASPLLRPSFPFALHPILVGCLFLLPLSTHIG
ncbi:hypothetical protein LX32DRAFT_428316 [Colletotrichum zoysiae]|uniref:Uncharacterized protein n=1 Tax=Colletotrichum zoysiae TaxID=1216348 RepID=A0AAD9M3N1_9PEZI|nr:hypothetical protein LX32DRAFT_428316 [Colletotrichum zoysiae]